MFQIHILTYIKRGDLAVKQFYEETDKLYCYKKKNSLQ